MVRSYADNVQDTTESTGVGPLILDNTPPVFNQSFLSAYGSGTTNNIPYEITHPSTAEVEAGYGSWNGTFMTFTRATVVYSSNANTFVSFTAGTKNIGVVLLAEDAINFGTVTSVGIVSGSLTITNSPITMTGNITAELMTTGVTPGTYQGLAVNANGIITAATNENYLEAVVDDTSPELGGNLNTNNHSITTSVSNGNITIAPNGTGSTIVGGIAFNQPTTFSIVDNQISPLPILTFSNLTYQSCYFDFRITKSGNTDFGTVIVFSSGAVVQSVQYSANTGTPSGVIFTATVSSNTVSLNYTSTSTGAAGSLVYTTREF